MKVKFVFINGRRKVYEVEKENASYHQEGNTEYFGFYIPKVDYEKYKGVLFDKVIKYYDGRKSTEYAKDMEVDPLELIDDRYMYLAGGSYLFELKRETKTL